MSRQTHVRLCKTCRLIHCMLLCTLRIVECRRQKQIRYDDGVGPRHSPTAASVRTGAETKPTTGVRRGGLKQAPRSVCAQKRAETQPTTGCKQARRLHKHAQSCGLGNSPAQACTDEGRYRQMHPLAFGSSSPPRSQRPRPSAASPGTRFCNVVLFPSANA